MQQQHMMCFQYPVAMAGRPRKPGQNLLKYTQLFAPGELLPTRIIRFFSSAGSTLGSGIRDGWSAWLMADSRTYPAQMRKLIVTVYRTAANICNNGVGAIGHALVCLLPLWMAK